MGRSDDLWHLPSHCEEDGGKSELFQKLYTFTSLQVLPYRLQDEFFKLHSEAGLETAVPTDTKDALMDPVSPSDDYVTSQEPLKLFNIESDLLNEFAPDFQEVLPLSVKKVGVNVIKLNIFSSACLGSQKLGIIFPGRPLL